MREAVESEGIKWHFNSPAAPNFGGLWEAGVRSVKAHLIQVVRAQEFYTVLVQVESVLNSRPLYPMSSDPNDIYALTPGRFLTLEPLTSLPSRDYANRNINPLQRWQLTQRLHADFWKRWHLDYLNTLQQRFKWTKKDLNIEVGVSLINIDCKSDDVHASDEDSEQSIEHEINSRIVPTNPLQDVNEPCCSRELNETPIDARQTVRANVIEMSPTDEKSMCSDDSEACCSNHLEAHRQHYSLKNAYSDAARKKYTTRIKETKTQRDTTYVFHGVEIRQKMYFFGTERYKNLIRHFNSKGLSARNHGLTESANRKTHVTPELREIIVEFIKAFTNQVANISYNPQQVGSAYFKASHKCSIFGIHDEKTGIQTNFLIDEANDIGKGPNATISMLYHYLETHPPVDTLILFADN
ncbi:hypothetical protein ILUMI_07183, partial [Ignelater luminosus]